jgi:hypothetical protein
MEVTSFEEIGFCLLRCAHVAQLGVGNPNIDDIPISKRDKKNIVFHLEMTMIVDGCLGNLLLAYYFACQGRSCSWVWACLLY